MIAEKSLAPLRPTRDHGFWSEKHGATNAIKAEKLTRERLLQIYTVRRSKLWGVAKSVDFVENDEYRINNELVSDWCSSSDSLPELRVGDRLEFKRPGNKHWGIYVGDLRGGHDQVVHLASDKRKKNSSKGNGEPSGAGPTMEGKLVPSVTNLQEIVGNDKFRINNERDRSYPPSPKADIVDKISRLLPDSGGKTERKITFKDSEDFVNYCRYDTFGINFGLVSDWCYSCDSLPALRVGDRLEFSGTAGPHTHWGIYVGDLRDGHDQVVRLVSSIKDEDSSLGNGEPSRAGPTMEGNLVASVTNLQEIVGIDKVRINNKKDWSFPPSLAVDIMSEINRLLPESRGRSARDINFTDSEDFVNNCRYDDLRINFGLVSDWCSSWYSLSGPRVADRLEFCGTAREDTHWGIFVGDWLDGHDQVVHLASSNRQENGSQGIVEPSSAAPAVEDRLVPSVGNLWELVGIGKVRINNKRDQSYPPLLQSDIVDEIRQLLLDDRGKSAWKITFKYSEDFVNYCRYDDLRINFGLVSKWCSSTDALPGLRVADRLEFSGTARPHTHWGIYVGDWRGGHDQVVHLTSAYRNEKSSQWIGEPSSAGPAVEDRLVPSVSNLQEIVGNDKVRINNKRDRSFPPSLRVDIVDEINRLLSDITGRSARKINFTNSEDFVNYCRYDDLRINFGLVSDWCSSLDALPRLRAGDKLEFKRTGYAHWGIYVGVWEGKHHQVVHFTLPDENKEKFPMKKTSYAESSLKVKPTLCVKSIEEVINDDRVRINNKRDEICPPFFGSLILREIDRQLKSQLAGYVQVYDLFSNNCEHFVNHCRNNYHCSGVVSFIWKIWERVCLPL